MPELTSAFTYKGSNNPVLNKISLNIDGPQLVSILGPNGAGKSTFIHCMNKLLEPTGGTVLVNGFNVKDITIKEMAKISSYVPYTSTDSFPLTVVDTILMGRHPHSKIGSIKEDLEIVHESLKLLNIEDLADSMFNELSAGQHQKVMLARGFAQEPRILFLDEPTSNLDIKYQLEITRILRRMSRQKNVLVVMISHDINIAAKYSDNIIVLHNHCIHSVGTPEQVITKEMLKEVYDVDAEIIMDSGKPHLLLLDDEAYDALPPKSSVVIPE
ncbi:MAG: ABC transporter ATP-binding protein [Candidatus Methanomethylophilus sp.]|nr:ABC transporter ATP-binding protein [Methanomethylophilus sp.]